MKEPSDMRLCRFLLDEVELGRASTKSERVIPLVQAAEGLLPMRSASSLALPRRPTTCSSYLPPDGPSRPRPSKALA